MHRKQYADSWSGNQSRQFEQEGLYQWMASFLGGYNRILEIGTGDGRSLSACAQKGHKVVSIDENPACLDLAENILKERRIPFKRIKREKLHIIGEDHLITYDVVDTKYGEENIITEGDITDDQHLEQWLNEVGPFDAVICWLIGTHGSRQMNKKIKMAGINSDGIYRLYVQNRVYVLADKLLRSGGILNIVDRGAVPDSEFFLKDILRAHREQASVTNLEVFDLKWREYREPCSKEAVKMVQTPGILGLRQDMSRLSFISVTSKKP